jgi:NitT/TauT family transport system permease protein
VSDVLRSLGATRLQILVKIGMPRSLPFYLASLKVAVTLAFVGAITSETVASNNGIGAMMIAAASDFNVALVFAAVVVVGALGVVMYALFGIAEARLTFWARRGAE